VDIVRSILAARNTVLLVNEDIDVAETAVETPGLLVWAGINQ